MWSQRKGHVEGDQGEGKGEMVAYPGGTLKRERQKETGDGGLWLLKIRGCKPSIRNTKWSSSYLHVASHQPIYQALEWCSILLIVQSNGTYSPNNSINDVLAPDPVFEKWTRTKAQSLGKSIFSWLDQSWPSAASLGTRGEILHPCALYLA